MLLHGPGVFASTMSCACEATRAFPVRVEAGISRGLPSFVIVGLGDAALREGRERVRAAVKATAGKFPQGRCVVNLSPASRRKGGAGLDLAVAVALIAAAGRKQDGGAAAGGVAGSGVPAGSGDDAASGDGNSMGGDAHAGETRIDLGSGHLPKSPEERALVGTAFLGELGLDGALRPVRGALAAAMAAAEAGMQRIVVPRECAREAALADGVEVYAAGSLGDVLELLLGEFAVAPVRVDRVAALRNLSAPTSADLADVRGQYPARRALEIAAAGFHHLLLTGPPGVGKTMLARRLPGILPPPTLAEAVEATAIHGVAGVGLGSLSHTSGGEAGRGDGREEAVALVGRPFRAPHHTISGAGLVGGGSVPTPGEISLAHNGVLFLDELPEFSPRVLNQLREPLEEGSLTISRAEAKQRLPASFLLVAAMNPCPCGYYGSDDGRCTCDEQAVGRYRNRISGPLLDRVDLFVRLLRPTTGDLLGVEAGESSSTVRERVCRARGRRAERGRRVSPELEELSAGARQRLAAAIGRWQFSARSVARVVSVARTIADLADSDVIAEVHLAEALRFRPHAS